MISIESIIQTLREHQVPEEQLQEVMRSYEIAKEIHKNQYRDSGEPYIIHPLSVAGILLENEIYHSNTICGALLHDTLEDAEIDFRREDIAELINPDVAEIVDGLTKLSRIYFDTKLEQNQANKRKFMNSLSRNISVALIKLADNTHNLRTLGYKPPEKQVENSLESMRIYVPIASSIGAYRFKNELEDLSLRYIDPTSFFRIQEEKARLEPYAREELMELGERIRAILSRKDIPNDIIFRTQTICSIYKKMKSGYLFENIYDLFYLKVLVEEVEECYRTVYVVHQLCPPINRRFMDYIGNPKPNMYQSLHTTVSHNNKLLKVKIRTYDMDQFDAYGVSSLWNTRKDMSPEEFQKIVDQLQFVAMEKYINKISKDDADYDRLSDEFLLSDHVYVYDSQGVNIELPEDATAFTFVSQVYRDSLDLISGVLVNEKEVPLSTPLKNGDQIIVKTIGEKELIPSNPIQKVKQLNGQNN